MLQRMPEPAGNDTVLNTAADHANIQVLYLWEEGNVPAKTKFTQDITGYFDNSFIVDYRLSPYTQEEGALDVARAVRFVRKNAEVYGIDPDDIAVMGIPTGRIVLNGWPHGFGSDGGLVKDYAAWLETILK